MIKVVAVIDDSVAAHPVLAMTRAAALAFGGVPEAVHVVEDGLETVRAEARAMGIPLHTLVGDPEEQLVRFVAQSDVTAAVVGSRSQVAGIRRAGHLALGLASRTDKPLVAVPPDARPPERLHTVLVAMEGTPGKARALRRTIAVSADAGLDLLVVHVDEEIPSFTDQVQHETEAYCQEFLTRNVIGTQRARLELRIGVPATEILDAVTEFHPDLVAVGWPHSDDPGRGAVAREIFDKSPIPVLLVAVD
jgi:nucleotide-binding universal stress UspA family protein